MNSRQLGNALRNARNQSIGSQEMSREKASATRVQDHGIKEAKSHNDTKTVRNYETSRNHNESTEKKSGRMKELSTAKIESVPFTWLRKQRTLPTKSKYADAANQLLKRVSVNMYNVKWWAILDSGATSNFLMTDAHMFSRTPTDDPINVTLPDGSKVRSTHKCVLDLPQLPMEA